MTGLDLHSAVVLGMITAGSIALAVLVNSIWAALIVGSVVTLYVFRRA